MDEEEVSRPLVLVHRPPNFHFPSGHRFATQFNLSDPLDSHDSTRSSLLCRHAFNIRVLLCVDPTPVSSDLLSLLPALELIDVADLAVGLLIDVLRKISAGDRFVQASSWAKTGDHALGSKNSRRKKSAVSFPYYPDVYELVVNSDVLVVCCALTEQTHHIINKDVMTTLGKAGVIINVGCGPLIDEKEMMKLLVCGEIGGIGLDVFENEPHVPNELFQLDNAVLSPHCAVATPECFDALEELIMSNLKAFFANKSLWSVVNLE
ncbi:hypothetical protein Patl1_26986 [Pistacia atlantica]|uniref:Uncharacterized protein n=1 Tax=Pistacia atlantica TaxID=434234 RepID=A0ACC1B4E0_9ROSI|nr:hypothetical protein Patl1_26986 [Pistacia atlantica]